MRVAIVDNMNNFGFVVSRYLRDKGIEVDLFCLPYATFKPEDDTDENVAALGYIKQFPFQPLPQYWQVPGIEQALAFLKDYDLVVAQGYCIGFLHRAGIKVDVYVPYGDDINGAFANPQHWAGFTDIALRDEFIVNHYQAVGRATAIVYGWEGALSKLGIPFINAPLPRLYAEQVKPLDLSAYFSREDFVAVNASRQMWASPADVTPEAFQKFGGYKRNDRFIQGYARFKQMNPGVRAKLVLFNYGPDVGASSALAMSLGVGDDLVIFEKMSRKHLLGVLAACSVGGDYFGHHIADIGFQETSHVMLAAGLPLLTYARSPWVRDCPFFHVESDEEIAHALSAMYRNPGLRTAVGEAGRAWWRQKIGLEISGRFLGLLDYVHGCKRSGGFDLAQAARIVDGQVIGDQHADDAEIARRYLASVAPLPA